MHYGTEDAVRYVARDALGLRGRKEPEQPGKSVAFRCPADLIEYIDEEGESTDRSATEVILDALRLDRDLNSLLANHREQIEAFAAARGVSLAKDLGRVLAQLCEQGLSSNEKRNRK